MSISIRTRLVLFCVCCILAVVPSQQVHAANSLKLELTALAKDIDKFVGKRGGGTVAVGRFTAASNVRGSSGPAIQLLLAGALRNLGLTVSADEYQYEVTGNYLGSTDKQSGAFGVKIVARVIDSDGTTLAEFPRFIFGEETVPRMLGVSVRTGPNDTALDRSRKINHALRKPQTNVRGTRIATTATTPFAVEILMKKGNDDKPHSVTQDSKGRPFVGIKKNEPYAVRLINDSQYKAAVNLSIDGINSFHFSDSKLTYWIVPAKSSVLIKGWRKDDSRSIEFGVTGYADTAAAPIKLKPSPSFGQISAIFSAAWAVDQAPPKDEAQSRCYGFVVEVEFKKELVRLKIGHVRDSIIVRYEK